MYSRLPLPLLRLGRRARRRALREEARRVPQGRHLAALPVGAHRLGGGDQVVSVLQVDGNYWTYRLSLEVPLEAERSGGGGVAHAVDDGLAPLAVTWERHKRM